VTYANPGKSKPIQNWRTPLNIFDPLNEEFGFGTDVFADDENALCPHYYTAERSAFDESDERFVDPAYANPEFGKGFILRALKWGIHAVRVQKRWPKMVFMLPLTVTKQWGRLAFSQCEVQLYEGRIAFDRPVNPDGKRSNGNNAGSMLVIVNQLEDDFRGVSAVRCAKTGRVIIDYREGT
jgi:phage N-6-adenine-methyltransferase